MEMITNYMNITKFSLTCVCVIILFGNHALIIYFNVIFKIFDALWTSLSIPIFEELAKYFSNFLHWLCYFKPLTLFVILLTVSDKIIFKLALRICYWIN